MYVPNFNIISLVIGWLLPNIALLFWVCKKSEKWPKVKGQIEFFRLQSAQEGSLHIRFYFYFNWLWNEYFWVLRFEFAKKCAKNGDLCKKVQVVVLFSTSMIQCAYCADLHWYEHLMILTANFLIFLFNSTLRSRSKVMVEFSDTSI